MGFYDTVNVPCPDCGAKYDAQSKGGECTFAEYDLDGADSVPADVLSNVNRHAPFICQCGCVFDVQLELVVKYAGVRRLGDNHNG